MIPCNRVVSFCLRIYSADMLFVSLASYPMSYLRRFFFSSLTPLVALALIVQAAPNGTAQQKEPAKQVGEQSEKQPSTQSANTDDSATELKDPLKTPDQNKRKATAAFMAGQAAQKKGELNDALERYKEAAKLDPTAADPLRAQAVLYRRMGRIQQAVAVAQKAIELDKDDHKTRLELAVLLTTRQQIDQASQLIDEALESKSLNKGSIDFVQLHTIRSRIFLLQRKISESADSYRVILEALLKPEDFGMDFREHQVLALDNASSFLTVGKVMLEVGDNKRALSAFDGEQRLKKDQTGPHNFWIALTHYRLDNLDDARKNLDLYFETGDRTAQALRLLADIDRASGQSDQTRAHLEALVEDERDAVVVMLFLGKLLIEQGELDDAADVFQKVLADSGEAGARLGLLEIHIARKDPDALISAMQKALRARIQLAELIPLKVSLLAAPEFAQEVIEAGVQLAKDDSSSLMPTGFFLIADIARDLKLDLETQEEALLQAALDGNPAQLLGIEILERLGFNQLLQNNTKEASKTYQKLLATPGLPNDRALEGLYRLSQSEAFSQNYDEAIQAIQAAMKLSDQNPQLNYQLGWVYVQASRFEEANKALEKAAQLAQGNLGLEFQTRLLQGDVLVRTKDFEAAITAYKKILEDTDQSDENTKQCRMRLSNAYVQAGDMANGEKYLEEVYAKYPDDIGVNNDLGYLYADQGKKLEQAEKMIRLAVEAEPENKAYLDSLGWVLFQMERYPEALVELEKANSDQDYRDSTLIEHMGDTHAKLNQKEKARKAWQEALDVESESTPNDQQIIDRLKKKLDQ